MTTVDECKSKVDIVLSPEDFPAEEKVSAIEACQVLGRVDEGGVDVACQEGQVWP